MKRDGLPYTLRDWLPLIVVCGLLLVVSIVRRVIA